MGTTLRLQRLIPALLLLVLLTPLFVSAAVEPQPPENTTQWLFWVAGLFLFCLALGVVAVLGGVGGGVLFVPIVGSLFPFHIDFVRGAGLLVALSAASTSSSKLLRTGHASLRLGLPFAVVASITAILGAKVGLLLPSQYVQIALGVTILAVTGLMYFSKKSDYPEVTQSDPLAERLQMKGCYFEPSLEKEICWKIHRSPIGFLLFALIGFLAGMFGLGAGWANVPTLNLLLGAPLKLSVGTSQFILTVADSAAAWVYLHQGAILAIIAIPSIIGIMLGSMVGTKLLSHAKPAAIRQVIIVLLLVAGVRSILKGVGL